ncbi:MAG: NAD(P)H-dependent oxidoreductase subunit E [Maritimibacter sp.]|nr:NAD(P)H-dependent oxidoreductase subunit E [Maritimibacter sp.]
MQDDVATEAATLAAIEAESGSEGPLLPILHRIQHALGHVPEAALPMIADALNITRAEVHGVVSFYPDFRDAPVPGKVVKICRAEACQAQGGAALEAAAAALSGRAHVEPVYCLGLCANGPAAMVEDRPMAAATVEKIAQALAQ